MDQCEHCKYWRDRNSNWDGAGDCRRFPPTMTGKHDRGGIVTAFPQTERREWCGEFVRSEKPRT